MGTDVYQSLEVKQLKVSTGGTFHRAAQVLQFPASTGKAGATATVGYVNTGVDTQMVTLAQNATADTWVVPLPNLKEGDIITAIGIQGQIESGGNTATVDYDLRAQTSVASGCTDASIQAGTQVSAAADTLLDGHTTMAADYTVIHGAVPYFLVTCTTAAATDIELLKLEIQITQQ